MPALLEKEALKSLLLGPLGARSGNNSTSMVVHGWAESPLEELKATLAQRLRSLYVTSRVWEKTEISGRRWIRKFLIIFRICWKRREVDFVVTSDIRSVIRHNLCSTHCNRHWPVIIWLQLDYDQWTSQCFILRARALPSCLFFFRMWCFFSKAPEAWMESEATDGCNRREICEM